jgi:hypothetical protein
MKKRAVILLLLVAVLGGLTWFALRLTDAQGGSDTRAFNFKIEDTTSISKITITDAFGQKFTLVKKDNTWTDSKGACISQANVSLILDAFNKIEFKGYLPKNSEKRFTELMATSYIKTANGQKHGTSGQQLPIITVKSCCSKQQMTEKVLSRS